MYKNSLDHHSPQMFKYSKRIFSSSPLPSINHPTHALARHVTPIRRNRILAVWRMFSGAISRNGGFEASLRWKERAMLAKRERIPVIPAILCVIFIINPLDNNFLSFVDWNERRMHQIWREGRKSQRATTWISFSSSLSFFFSLALSFSFRFDVSRNDQKLKSFRSITILFTIERCITAGHPTIRLCSLIRKTVTCCAPRERKNQIFRLFWRRVSNHWINPQTVAQMTLSSLFCAGSCNAFHPPVPPSFKARANISIMITVILYGG